MLVLKISGCSFLYGDKNSLKEKTLNLNKEIIENYTKAISKDPNNPFFFLERGKAKHEYGDFIGAIKDFNYSYKIKPDLKVIFYRAKSRFSYRDFKGAIKDYEKLNFIKDFKDQIFYNIASAQIITFNYQDSINNYSKSIKYDADYSYAYLYRGNAKFRINDYSGAIEDYGNSIRFNKKSQIAFNNRGVSNFKLRNYISALEDFKKSLKINPRNYSTLYNKSLTHFEMKEIKKACIDLKKSIKLGKEVFKDEFLKICI